MHDTDPLATLVAEIGRPGFGAAVMAAYAAHAGARLCSAFALAGGAPRVLVAESSDADRSPFAQIASLRYADRYWRRDTETLYNLGRAHRKVLTARRSARSIRDLDYRLECYSEGAVGERLSICRAGPVGLIVNAYRGKEDGHFAPGEIEWVEATAPVVVAAAGRHEALTRQTPVARDPRDPAATAAFFQSLPGPGLSQREGQVLAHALLGSGEAETAAHLGLALTSVATYRRRGYAKLGVHNRRHLRRYVATLSDESRR